MNLIIMDFIFHIIPHERLGSGYDAYVNVLEVPAYP